MSAATATTTDYPETVFQVAVHFQAMRNEHGTDTAAGYAAHRKYVALTVEYANLMGISVTDAARLVTAENR